MDINSLKVKDFCYLMRVYNDDIEEIDKISQITDYFNIKVDKDLLKYVKIDKIFSEKLDETIKNVEISGEKYDIIDFYSINMAQFIDIYSFFSDIWLNFHKLIAILLIKSEKKVENYDSKVVNEFSKVILEQKIGDFYGIYCSFSVFFGKLMESINNLGGEREEYNTETEAFMNNIGKKWGILSIFYQLLGDDITKIDKVLELRIVDCLNYLSYKADMNKITKILTKNN